MCFGTPDIETPSMPVMQEAGESKNKTYKQAAKRKGYQSTILAGESQEATTGKKRLLGE